ncbi:hypothetical protein Lal_00020999 [Lupinus albus]|nr:hypothetical protein Lal_00020999 [Lupinus albus]
MLIGALKGRQKPARALFLTYITEQKLHLLDIDLYYLPFHLDVCPTPQFLVMIGNDAHIYFIGVDAAFGIEWLRTLDSVIFDFSIPSMTFIVRDTTITLKKDSNTKIQPSTFLQLSILF